MALPTGKVSEIVVRVNGQPVFSGSKMGANMAVLNALNKAASEGRPEPEVRVTERTVDYDLPDQDHKKVTEAEITL